MHTPQIIDSLEARLQRLVDNGDHWACEHAAERLAQYYRSKNRENDCKRVIKSLGYVFEKMAREADSLIASTCLGHMHLIYTQFNMAEDAEHIARMLREIGPKIRGEMKKISTTIEVPRDKAEAYLGEMITGESDQVLDRITTQFIPRRGDIEVQLTELAQHAPLSFLFHRQISDYQGRLVAIVGSLKDDLDGHVVIQMAQNMSISGIYLDEVLNRAIGKFGLDHMTLTDYIFQALIFAGVQRNLLVRGIEAYINHDYIVAIHLIIPQIEAAVRFLVESSGGAVLERGRSGGFHLMTLDKLLRTERMTQTMGEDICLYFRVVLTDQRGWNVRNDVSHGIMLDEHFSKGVADRLLHILLVLAKVQSKGD